MIWTILGCGTSTGVPCILCKCSVCQSKRPRNRRLRASAWVQVNGKNLLIDTSTDLRQQALTAKIPRVDGVLYTHPHADHIHGIDELRGFNFAQKNRISIWANDWTSRDLKIKFSYIFNNLPSMGGGIPQLDLNTFDASDPCISVLGETVIPLSLKHGNDESVGYRIGNVAYVTDCSEIPPTTQRRLEGLETLFLDCVRIRPHRTHFNIDQALQTALDLAPQRTYLTHLGHDFDYYKWAKKLPKGVQFAYDGLTVKFKQGV